ncbi:peptidase M50 [Staphylothermus hellenicus]|uniref:Peptidase M50 n=1 Tax=Staphylothermus hellenicus (strain DSM 12710 / JCM 10830 / BK20S6-10-b1 / P8) TaxID=591019 RepID=D7D8G6_STAHD|nr:peptidase M50 [Staphylothermus hellenicus]ADI32062.1 peptidase M50 [Staphylothermus hellenicus DSM 12710]
MSSIIKLNEALSLIIASIVVSLVFGLDYLLSGNLVVFSIISTGAIIAMVPHELAHRWSARRMGCYSRYVLDPTGLLLTIITAIPFIPFKIIMPGYTLVISHHYDPMENKRINGVVSLAGPVTNILFATISFFTVVLCLKTMMCSMLLFGLAYWTALLNSWVAFFNLLPIPPLDGSKVISWKPILWIISFVFSIGLFITLQFGLF